MFGKKNKISDLKTKLVSQVSIIKSQVKKKVDFRDQQARALANRFLLRQPLKQNFDNLISALVCIHAGEFLTSQFNQIISSDMSNLSKKCEVSADIQLALEHLYAYAQSTRNPELQDLMDSIKKNHAPSTNISCSHEVHVYLSNQPINEEDIVTYFPIVIQMCGINDINFLQAALPEYSTILAPHYAKMAPKLAQQEMVHQNFVDQQARLYNEQNNTQTQHSGQTAPYVQGQYVQGQTAPYVQQQPGPYYVPTPQPGQNIPPYVQQQPAPYYVPQYVPTDGQASNQIPQFTPAVTPYPPINQNQQYAQIPPYPPQNQFPPPDYNPYQMPYNPPPVTDITPQQLEQITPSIQYPEVPDFQA